ncbi:hypothetical protein [Streptomyces griseorubiginosus]|uniref:hypothetical protein n=1 Tax=Streptomyces griseorubiginosus TaxID=67304 RepID=UPI003317B1F4
MSITAPETTTAPHGDDDSYNTGHSDGELAAITRLSSRRAHARAAMAEPYDPAYAAGYIDGFIQQTQANAAHRLRQLIAPSRKDHR